MENIVFAGSALVAIHILWTHPTPSNSFIKMAWRSFCRVVRAVRKFIVERISACLAVAWDLCVRFDRWAASEHSDLSENEDFSEEWVDPAGHPLHCVPYRTSEIFDQKNIENSSFIDSENISSRSSDGTENLMSAEEVQEAIERMRLHVRSEELKRYLEKARSLRDNYESAIENMTQDYDRQIQEIEARWKSTLRMTEDELLQRISELSMELNRLTVPNPHADGKEQFRILQVMRGAGLSRSRIVGELFNGKLEGNSRPKYQKLYDDLIFAYGVDWLLELHSLGQSPQKIVALAWGDFKDGSAPKYIARVEQAIGKAETATPSKIILMHRAG